MSLLAVLLAVSLQLKEVNVTGYRSEVESGNMRIVTTLAAEEILQMIPSLDKLIEKLKKLNK